MVLHNIVGLMGTGMVPSSSTFRTHLGMVIRDLSRLLHAALHGMEALIYNDYLGEAAASTCLAIIFGGIASSLSWFLHSTGVPMQLPYQCSH